MGYDTLEEYTNTTDYYGATIGRVCNRIGNARFVLNGKEYTLNENNGINNLHGGKFGFNKQIWDYSVDGEKLTLRCLSKDGEEGFSGNLQIKVVFYISDNDLVIEYFAKTDEDTIYNLTKHSFFNLNGEGSGDVLNHKLQIDSDYILENNEKLIPTGNLINVKNTPYDFNKLEYVGKRINEKIFNYSMPTVTIMLMY